MSTPPIAFTGAILAGGRSTRMGRDKAFLEFEGAPLIQRQANLLRTLGARELLISGRNDTTYPAPDARVVHDQVAEAGPLAGLAAVLSAATCDHVLVLAVDLPRMTTDYLRTLLSEAALAGLGIVPATERGFEPLAALYPKSAAQAALRRLENKQFALQTFVQELVGLGLSKSLPIKKSDLVLFANWNSPDDLSA